MLDKQIFLEIIDRDKLKKVIEDTARDKLIGNYREKYAGTEKQHLQKILNATDKEGNLFVNYKKTRANFGRVFAYKSLSLGCLRKEIREILTKDYIDYDICNCHPVILIEIADRNSINLPGLRKYIENREDYIIKVQNCMLKPSRQAAKELFLRIMYGGSNLVWIQENPLHKNLPEEISSLELELNQISKKLQEIYPAINLATRNKPNHDASFLATLLQDYERKCLEAMYKSVQPYVGNRAILLFDGIMLPKKFAPENTIELFTKATKELGFSLNFSKNEIGIKVS